MSESKPNSSGRLLVADDDPLFREGLARQLASAGYSVAEVDSGAEALAILSTDSFDCVLADIRMPGNQDLELVRSIGTTSPGMPVILITGNPTLETATQSVRLPVFAYLCKPFERTELLSLVSQAVAAGRTRRQVRESRDRLRGLDEELADLESRLSKPESDADEPASHRYVRLTLRNLAVCLGDLERALAETSVQPQSPRPDASADLVAALKHTVEVLEKTRKSFKSRELGDLRHRLEAFLSDKSRGV